MNVTKRRPWALWPLVWSEWRHQPLRHLTLLLSLALGVALAAAVHLINASALAEFAQAQRALEGESDLSLRGPRQGFDEALYEQAANVPQVLQALPVLEQSTQARSATGQVLALRVLGLDALVAARLAPQLLALPQAGLAPLAVLQPANLFINATLRQALALRDGDALELRTAQGWRALRVAGSVAAPGAALAVMDVAGAQTLFDLDGRLTRIDLRLAAGADTQAVAQALALPAGVQALTPQVQEQQASGYSRAYRLNLTLLALVALFVAGFLVFSVQSLAVAQRRTGLGLLGVLGLDARQRRNLLWLEAALLGAVGSAIGVVGACALAGWALRALGGDLFGEVFQGAAVHLQADAPALMGFGLLGLACTLAATWWPARTAGHLSPLRALQGLAGDGRAPSSGTAKTPRWPALALMASAVPLALAPSIHGLPLAGYAAVAAWLLGGMWLVPSLVSALLAAVGTPRGVLAWLALQRAGQARAQAVSTVAGVVASVALSVALMVMVASFRHSMLLWLDQVLPAQIYARILGGSAAAQQAWLDPALVRQLAATPGVARSLASRSQALRLSPDLPPLSLLARPLGDAASALPLLAPALPQQAGRIEVHVSEAVAALYGAQPGAVLALPLAGTLVAATVVSVWRDYARPFGAVVIDLASYQQLTGDMRISEMAFWLAPGSDEAELLPALRQRAADGPQLEWAQTGALRATALSLFDRSFAVTHVLQAVAVAIGLAGVAASLSAQTLARRGEFALLAHLGLTRGQTRALVAGEALVWLAAGVLTGLLLGIGISLVLVHVINPQSFHWSMELHWPLARLAGLCGAVGLAGAITAHLACASALRGPLAQRVGVLA